MSEARHSRPLLWTRATGFFVAEQGPRSCFAGTQRAKALARPQITSSACNPIASGLQAAHRWLCTGGDGLLYKRQWLLPTDAPLWKGFDRNYRIAFSRLVHLRLIVAVDPRMWHPRRAGME